jgi:hypothetical protein
MQPSRSLLAFSVIAESFSSTGDILQGLVPLFEPIAYDFAGTRFGAADFAKELKRRYDFEIPLAVAEDWAKRLESAGFLENVSGVKGVADYRYKVLENTSLNLSTEQIDQLIEDLKTFVLNNAAGVKFEDSIDITQEFYKRLVRIESLVQLHGNEAQRTKAPTPATLTLSKKQQTDTSDHDEEDNASFHLDFLFASFIDTLSKRNDGSLQLLAQISGGAMLAEVVLSFQDPPKRGESLASVDFYLDAPLVMDLLGFDKQREKYAKEMYGILKKEGAQLWIFDHGVDEVDRAIHARISEQNGWQRPMNAGERILITSMKGRVPHALDSLGIKIMRFQGDAFERSLAYFSKDQEDLLFSQLNFHTNEIARSADARSLANIERLRRNRRIPIGSPLLRAGPVLVTRNTALASIARRFMKNLSATSVGSLSNTNVEADICILDGYLAGLLWITVGGSAKQLPYSQLVANCATAISPKRGVITKAIKLLSSIDLNQAVAFEAIMQDERAEHYMMELTLCDSSLVTDGNIVEIYEKIRQSVGKETEERLTAEFNKKLEEQSKEHASTLARISEERDEDIKKVMAQLEKLKSDLLETNTNVLQQNLSNKEQQAKIDGLQDALKHEVALKEESIQKSLTLAGRVGKTVPVILSVLIALLLYFAQGYFSTLDGNWKPIANLMLASLAVFGFIVAFWDNPEILFGQLRIAIVAKCYQLIVSLRGLSEFSKTREINWKDLTIQNTTNLSADEPQKR